MTLRVGVIGTGNIGADHVRRLSSAGVGGGGHRRSSTWRPSGRRTWPGRWAPPRTPAWTGLVDAADVDAVVIASPGPLHAEQVLACIAAGKPVLCEKPLATTGEDALKVIEAEVALGRRLVQVGFMRRYDAGLPGGQGGDRRRQRSASRCSCTWSTATPRCPTRSPATCR